MPSALRIITIDCHKPRILKMKYSLVIYVFLCFLLFLRTTLKQKKTEENSNQPKKKKKKKRKNTDKMYQPGNRTRDLSITSYEFFHLSDA